MKLITHCKACNNPIKIKGWFIESREDLSRKRGKDFYERCKHCGAENLIHVNEVVAVGGHTNTVVFIISILASLLLAVIFWRLRYFIIIILILPFISNNALRKSQQNKINSFNETFI